MLVPQSSLTRRLHKKTDSQLEYSDIPDQYAPIKSKKKNNYQSNNNQKKYLSTTFNGKIQRDQNKKLTLGLKNYQDIKQAYQKMKSNCNNPLAVTTDQNIGNCQTNTKPCDFDFMPKICDGNSSIKTKRNFNEFIQNQQNFLHKKNQKIQRIRTQITEASTVQCTNTPKIDKKSKRISEVLQQGQVFSRLSKQRHPSQIGMFQQQGMFIPKILKKSKSLKRNDKIENLLYEDAKRRNQQKKFTQTQNGKINTGLNCKINKNICQNQVIQRISLMNSNTNLLVFNKIKNEALQMLEKQEEISPILAISITSELFNVDLNPNKDHQTQQLCHKVLMYMIETTDQKINTAKFISFIQIIVMGYEDHQNQSLNYTYYSKEEQELIKQELGYFYRTRLAKDRKVKQPQYHSFQPKTLQNSIGLAQNHRGRKLQQIAQFLQNNETNVKVAGNSLRIQDLFLLDSIRKKAQIQAKKREKDDKQLIQCSFRPSLEHSSKWKSRKKNDNLSEEKSKRKRIMSYQSKKLKTPVNQFKEQFEDYLQISHTLNDQSHKNFDTLNNKRLQTQTTQFGIDTKQKKKKRIVLKGKRQIKDFDKNLFRMSLGRKMRQYANKSKERGYQKNQNYTKKTNKQKLHIIQQDQMNKGYSLRNSFSKQKLKKMRI